MKTALLVLQIIVSLLFILVILSQEKGVAAGGTFGGSGQVFRGRRGIDRVLLWMSIVLSALFVVISLSFIFVDETITLPGSPSGATAETDTSGGLPIGGLPEGVTVTPLPLEESSNAE